MKQVQSLFSNHIVIIILFTVLFTLFWAIFEKILFLNGIDLDLSAGPIGFDLNVISLFIKINPGTMIGILLGYLVSRFVK